MDGASVATPRATPQVTPARFVSTGSRSAYVDEINELAFTVSEPTFTFSQRAAAIASPGSVTHSSAMWASVGSSRALSIACPESPAGASLLTTRTAAREAAFAAVMGRHLSSRALHHSAAPLITKLWHEGHGLLLACFADAYEATPPRASESEFLRVCRQLVLANSSDAAGSSAPGATPLRSSGSDGPGSAVKTFKDPWAVLLKSSSARGGAGPAATSRRDSGSALAQRPILTPAAAAAASHGGGSSRVLASSPAAPASHASRVLSPGFAASSSATIAAEAEASAPSLAPVASAASAPAEERITSPSAVAATAAPSSGEGVALSIDSSADDSVGYEDATLAAVMRGSAEAAVEATAVPAPAPEASKPQEQAKVLPEQAAEVSDDSTSTPHPHDGGDGGCATAGGDAVDGSLTGLRGMLALVSPHVPFLLAVIEAMAGSDVITPPEGQRLSRAVMVLAAPDPAAVLASLSAGEDAFSGAGAGAGAAAGAAGKDGFTGEAAVLLVLGVVQAFNAYQSRLAQDAEEAAAIKAGTAVERDAEAKEQRDTPTRFLMQLLMRLAMGPRSSPSSGSGAEAVSAGASSTADGASASAAGNAAAASSSSSAAASSAAASSSLVTAEAMRNLVELVKLMHSSGLFAAAAASASREKGAGEGGEAEEDDPDGPPRLPAGLGLATALPTEMLVAGALAAVSDGDETLFTAWRLYASKALPFKALARVVVTLAMHNALAATVEKTEAELAQADAEQPPQTTAMDSSSFISAAGVPAIAAPSDAAAAAVASQSGEAASQTWVSARGSDDGTSGRSPAADENASVPATSARTQQDGASAGSAGGAARAGRAQPVEDAADDEADAADEEDEGEPGDADAEAASFADAHIALLAAMQNAGLLDRNGAKDLVRLLLRRDARILSAWRDATAIDPPGLIAAAVTSSSDALASILSIPADGPEMSEALGRLSSELASGSGAAYSASASSSSTESGDRKLSPRSALTVLSVQSLVYALLAAAAADSDEQEARTGADAEASASAVAEADAEAPAGGEVDGQDEAVEATDARQVAAAPASTVDEPAAAATAAPAAAEAGNGDDEDSDDGDAQGDPVSPRPVVDEESLPALAATLRLLRGADLLTAQQAAGLLYLLSAEAEGQLVKIQSVRALLTRQALAASAQGDAGSEAAGDEAAVIAAGLPDTSPASLARRIAATVESSIMDVTHLLAMGRRDDASDAGAGAGVGAVGGAGSAPGASAEADEANRKALAGAVASLQHLSGSAERLLPLLQMMERTAAAAAAVRGRGSGGAGAPLTAGQAGASAAAAAAGAAAGAGGDDSDDHADGLTSPRDVAEAAAAEAELVAEAAEAHSTGEQSADLADVYGSAADQSLGQLPDLADVYGSAADQSLGQLPDLPASVRDNGSDGGASSCSSNFAAESHAPAPAVAATAPPAAAAAVTRSASVKRHWSPAQSPQRPSIGSFAAAALAPAREPSASYTRAGFGPSQVQRAGGSPAAAAAARAAASSLADGAQPQAGASRSVHFEAPVAATAAAAAPAAPATAAAPAASGAKPLPAPVQPPRAPAPPTSSGAGAAAGAPGSGAGAGSAASLGLDRISTPGGFAVSRRVVELMTSGALTPTQAASLIPLLQQWPQGDGSSGSAAASGASAGGAAASPVPAPLRTLVAAHSRWTEETARQRSAEAAAVAAVRAAAAATSPSPARKGAAGRRDGGKGKTGTTADGASAHTPLSPASAAVRAQGLPPVAAAAAAATASGGAGAGAGAVALGLPEVAAARPSFAQLDAAIFAAVDAMSGGAGAAAVSSATRSVAR